MRNFARHFFLPARTQVCITANGTIEFFVAAHGVLKDTDCLGQRTNFVIPITERYGDRTITRGDGLRDGCDIGDGLDDASRDDQCAGDRQDDRKTGEDVSCSAVRPMLSSICL